MIVLFILMLLQWSKKKYLLNSPSFLKCRVTKQNWLYFRLVDMYLCILHKCTLLYCHIFHHNGTYCYYEQHIQMFPFLNKEQDMPKCLLPSGHSREMGWLANIIMSLKITFSKFSCDFAYPSQTTVKSCTKTLARTV